VGGDSGQDSLVTTRRVWMTCAIAAVLALGVRPGAQAPAIHSTANGEWPTYGGDLASTKYSPLDQITGSNFGSRRSPGARNRPTDS
jgi:glucose dehydrogenase